MIGMFVEPEECYQQRMIEQKQRMEREGLLRLARMDDLLTELILEALGEPGDPSMLITDVANIVARKLNRCFGENREEAKLRVFERVSFLIKIRRLTRVERNWVRIPDTDAGYKAWLAAQDEMIKNLPVPNL